MALFRRNKTDQTGMPPEVQDYYQAENRQRAGVAWILAFGTLLVTVLIVLGLFFGGRWAFRKIKNNDKPTPALVENETSNSDSSATAPATPNSSSTSSTSGSNATPTTNAPANPPTSGTAITPTPAQTPSTAALPNTGPGDTLAVFVAVSVLAYILHRRFSAVR